MKNIHQTYLIFSLLSIAFVSCGGDDILPYPTPQPEPQDTNINANTMLVKDGKRLEMPHIDASMFYTSHHVTVGQEEKMNLALQWNSTMRHADWVAFSWDATTSLDETNRNEAWAWDPSIPKTLNAVSDKDHSSDGYDKGHLCASDDRAYSLEANMQTFYLSNISPQLSSFNQKFWARLEQKVRTWGRLTQTGVYDTVYVAKGGTTNNLLKNFIGTKPGSDKVTPTTTADGFTLKGLAVPQYYFMAILAVKDGRYSAISFCVPHRENLPASPTSEDFKEYVMSVDGLEQFTGLDFFCNLTDDTENEVEAKVDTAQWNW